jgi:[acyl-carrier-protein] S-malonyltransferase
MKKCYVFPGQGGQTVGMGKDLYEKNAEAKAVFDEVDDALGEKLSSLIFNGPAEELNLTANAQPAIFAVSMAMYLGWKAPGTAGPVSPDFISGHSLGEYSALCAAGAIGIGDSAKLLRRRGELMQSAVSAGQGAMAAIIGDVDVASVCADAAVQTKGVCEVANDNGGGQFVVSGNVEAVDAAMEIARGQGAKIVKKLSVAVPAHCSLMLPIAEEFRAEIDLIEWRAPLSQFVSNKTADVMNDVSEIKDALVFQLTHGVRWRESVLMLKTLGAEEFIEIGPGSVLTGLCKRIVPELNCYKLEI